MDAATGDYVGWITCGSLLRQILRALYPRMLAPELLAQDDLEAFLYRPENLADASPDARTVLAAMVSEAETQYTSAWARVVRAGDDGDACHIAFADTTLLDFVSRGLDARSLSEKRPGDFEPCHRVGVYAESRDETVRAPFANTRERHEDDDDTRDEASDGKSASEHEHESEEVEGSIDPPRWVAIVSQLDVVSLMAADADQLGAFPHVTTMETLGFASSSWGVVAVTSDLPTAACFAIMNNCEVSGVPVLDRRRRMVVGSLSVSDARRFDSPESLRRLAVPVGDFLREKVWSETSGRAPKPPPGAPDSPRVAPDEPPDETPGRERDGVGEVHARRAGRSPRGPSRRSSRRCERWRARGYTECTCPSRHTRCRGGCARARTSCASSPPTPKPPREERGSRGDRRRRHFGKFSSRSLLRAPSRRGGGGGGAFVRKQTENASSRAREYTSCIVSRSDGCLSVT